jgi:hypothetical protein
MTRETSKIASSNLLNGDKLYLTRARKALPILVRQARAGQPIFYSKLAEEIGMPNARNLNFVLGSIGNALIKLSKENKIDIPFIQCLVTNKNTGMPGKGIGWFISEKDFSKLSSKLKQEIVKQQLVKVFAFEKWDWVLSKLDLSPLKPTLEDELNAAGRVGGGGESIQHKLFKEFISNNPSVLGLNNRIGKGQQEFILPSSDRIDVLFVDNITKIGVEVKSKISDRLDILRGIFQCVKYKCLIEADQAVRGEKPDSKVILALEGYLPLEMLSVANILGIEVKDNIKIK